MGSPVTLRAPRQVARVILVVLASFLATFVLFSTGPLRAFSVAQEPTSRFQIQFVNPSGYSQGDVEEVSTKPETQPEGTEPGSETYHLVAWVNELPGSANVQFRYRDPSTTTEVTIGNATQTALPDTFEFFWDVPPELKDGQLTLYAVLFDGTSEVARDTESDLTMNDTTPDPESPNPNPNDTEPRGETVEIVYPTNGGKLGVFRPRDASNAVLLMRLKWSDGVVYFRGYYSISAPGTEPAWSLCTGGNSGDVFPGGDPNNGNVTPDKAFVCTLAAAVDPEDVTAVAVVANDTDIATDICCGYDPTQDDAGDAHVVQPYYQMPTNITLAPTVQNELPTDRCAPAITATITDQEGEAIYRANLDVHAKEPDDRLAFDSGMGRPTQGNHRQESAVNCAPPPPNPANPPIPGGLQGEHDDPTGPDLKHAEGTTTFDGTKAFRLFSPVEGTTQITAWSEFDDDDLRCTDEPSANASIGWLRPAAQPTGLPVDLSTCPDPTPSTSTPTPTDTETTPPPDPRGCTITGTDQGESLSGTPGRDVICGLGGNDIIRGLGGNDLIYGDAGDDDLRGGDGHDVIKGAAGKDTITGGDGEDILQGLRNNDTVHGGAGGDRLSGNGGIDTLRGSGGADRLDGGPRDDVLTGGSSSDVLYGRGGDDVLSGGPGRDRCRGGAGRDHLRGCDT